MYKIAPILTLLLLACLTAFGQQAAVDQKSSKLTIAGTSTLHDWTMEATEIRGSATIRKTEGTMDVQNLTLTIPVKGLESGKGSMDKNAFEALEYKRNPAITYRLEQVNGVTKVEGGYLLSSTGTLTIAGKSRRINMDVRASLDGNGYLFSGKVPLKMTDFGVDPPTALLGSIKTGNEIDIIFNVRYQ
ncbi:YceI family protein [Roseivirga sp. BDSF3-8]|uniref:YceI family protein n=1 Tax=Roseivirga sp. BDSF3-8 TaxID=3241598 RepID=UPI003531D962